MTDEKKKTPERRVETSTRTTRTSETDARRFRERSRDFEHHQRPFGFAIFFLELVQRENTQERDAIAHPIEHRRATRHRRQEKKQIFFADVSTNARDRVSRES